MAREKTFQTLGPFPLDADRAVLSWLAREAAEKAVAAEGYELVEHTEREVPVSDLPPKTLKHALSMRLNPADYLWLEQTTVRDSVYAWQCLLASYDFFALEPPIFVNSAAR